MTLFSVLRTPSFQALGGKLAAGFLSEQIHSEVYIDGLRISDFLFIEILGLRVNDFENQEMLSIDEMRVKLNSFSFKEHKIDLNRVSLEGGGFFLTKYPGDSLLNLGRFVREFGYGNAVSSRPSSVWSIQCDEVTISDFVFSIRNGLPDSIPGINFKDLLIEGIFVDISDISVTGDSIAAFVNHVAGSEKSGMELLNFSGDAKVSSTGIRVQKARISTGQSSLDLDLEFLYKDYRKLAYFLDSVYINSIIRSSLVTMSDIGYFAPGLLVMNDPVMFSGVVEGPVSDFSATDITISLGDFTEFKGLVTMKGLPDIRSTYCVLDIERMITTPDDINNFSFPVDDHRSIIPTQFDKLGFTSIDGQYEGYYNDFHADLKFNTDAGNIYASGKMKETMPGHNFVFSGEIEGYYIQLGSIFENEDLGALNLE